MVGYSNARKNPLWVAYRLFRLDKFPTLPRPGGFKTDDRTRALVRNRDYTHSGYDRGHMAPNDAIGDCYGPDAQLATFLMSNVVPQRPELNRHLWARLEQYAKANFAVRFAEVWVVTGPVFDERIERLRSGVEIPDAFFKIVLDETRDGVRAIAWVIPQGAERNDSLDRFLTSVDAIEGATGLDFFRELADGEEDAIEVEVARRIW